MKSIRYSLFSILCLSLTTGCNEDKILDLPQPTEAETPLEVTALLHTSSAAQTRAQDKIFMTGESGDEILAYLRHVTWDGTAQGERTAVAADQAPMLVTFMLNSAMTAYDGSDITPIGTGVELGMTSDNTNQCTNLTAYTTNATTYRHDTQLGKLFWDDFSLSSEDGSTDLRTEGHYLQSYYGYCLNGGTPKKTANNEAEAFDPTTGVLGWEIQTNQSASTGNPFTTSDLLWSAEQTPVRYAHKSASTDDTRDGLILPYTHALSKVSIKVTIDKDNGFGDWTTASWNNATIALNGMRTQCTATAPTATLKYVADGSDLKDITMRQFSETDAFHATYDAIVVPSVLTPGTTFATLTDFDGNTYTVTVTDKMLQEATDANDNKGWGKQLTDTEEQITQGTSQAATRATIERGKGYQMKSGVHYVLNVTLRKTEVKVIATLKDWETVEAEGFAEIKFNADVKTTNIYNEITTDGASFGLWRLASTGATDQSMSNADFGDTPSTTATFDNNNDDSATEDTWVCAPILYWPDGTTSYYFRALAQSTDDEKKYAAVTAYDAAQGTDLLWATTAAHTGYEADNTAHQYDAGAAITPRTGEVPLAFEHAMSKITVKLVTTTGSDQVDLTGAKISLVYNYDKAVINLSNGSMSDLSYSNTTDHVTMDKLLPANAAVSEEGTRLNEIPVIPQSLTQDKESGDRLPATIHYTSDELYTVGGVSYVKASLTPLLYTEEEILAHNGSLPEAKQEDDELMAAVYYSYSEYSQHSTNDYASDPSFFLPITKSDYDNILSDNTKTKPGIYWTQEEIDDAKAKVLAEGYVEGSDPTAEEVAKQTTKSYKISPVKYDYSYYVGQKLHLPITKTEFDKLSPASKEKTPATYYTQEEADTHNAALPGAWNELTIKDYETNAQSKQATTDTVKNTDGPNDQIRFVITLKDGTTYSLVVANCLDDLTGQQIQEWLRGRHYIYTITLRLEAITLRALVKDWEKTYGQGEATLDW